MARAPASNALTSLEYRNPVTSGPALATLGCLFEDLAARARTRPCRETASSIIAAARGTGTLSCGGQTFALLPNDVAAIPAIPAWTWHQMIAGDDDLILFRVTDRPIHDAFGLHAFRKRVSSDAASGGDRRRDRRSRGGAGRDRRPGIRAGRQLTEVGAGVSLAPNGLRMLDRPAVGIRSGDDVPDPRRHLVSPGPARPPQRGPHRRRRGGPRPSIAAIVLLVRLNLRRTLRRAASGPSSGR